MDLLIDPCPRKTRSDLEWDRLLAALAHHAVGAMGKDLARALPFGKTRSEVRVLLAEAAEATRSLEKGEPLPVSEVPDVREAVSRLGKGGVLAPQELRALAQLLTMARVLRRFLHARREACPALHASCSTDPTLDAVADDVSRAFDADGTLADNASPRLRELRGEYQASRARIVARLEDMMARYDGVLQDRFVTEREGRYVVPVRSDAHERFPGIVHATSASGSTLFVEPRAIIPMGNRLKVLEADVQREEIAVYTRLSALCADALPSIEASAEAVARADVRAATARLAGELHLAFPTVVDEARLDLKAARHPLLVLDALGTSSRESVIPSDVTLAGGHGIVVSGPNAGGKTVALKAMGLGALMIRAGLPIACDPASTIGIFDLVLTDVGDDQSLHKNLSTFSAHVKNLAAILADTQPGALILLDELAGGTDPREGEALAAGVLDSLCARGGAVAATTHYEGLKALALGDKRFQNASVGFDLATMTPTFRLALGVPGSSSALAVARRFGLPETVLARAERFLGREEHNFETLIKRLNDERAALDLARQAALAREQDAEGARTRLEAELALVKEREGRVVSREAEALLSAVRRAREELRGVEAKLRTKKLDLQGLQDASRALDRVAGEVALGGELSNLVAKRDETARDLIVPSELRKGMRVYVPRLRAEAQVLDVAGDTVRVTAGAMKLTVTALELRHVAEQAPPTARSRGGKGPNRGPPERDQAAPREAPFQTSDNTCDLRGLRADDALSLATTFLDRSINERRGVAFLIHGHGTGALREAIRKELRASTYVAHFRAGESSEGGDGVTVVWLA